MFGRFLKKLEKLRQFRLPEMLTPWVLAGAVAAGTPTVSLADHGVATTEDCSRAQYTSGPLFQNPFGATAASLTVVYEGWQDDRVFNIETSATFPLTKKPVNGGCKTYLTGTVGISNDLSGGAVTAVGGGIFF